MLGMKMSMGIISPGCAKNKWQLAKTYVNGTKKCSVFVKLESIPSSERFLMFKMPILQTAMAKPKQFFKLN